jgi:hypothetical protein
MAVNSVAHCQGAGGIKGIRHPGEEPNVLEELRGLGCGPCGQVLLLPVGGLGDENLATFDGGIRSLLDRQPREIQ